MLALLLHCASLIDYSNHEYVTTHAWPSPRRTRYTACVLRSNQTKLMRGRRHSSTRISVPQTRVLAVLYIHKTSLLLVTYSFIYSPNSIKNTIKSHSETWQPGRESALIEATILYTTQRQSCNLIFYRPCWYSFNSEKMCSYCNPTILGSSVVNLWLRLNRSSLLRCDLKTRQNFAVIALRIA